jgi:GT2 family glycosyltransferase
VQYDGWVLPNLIIPVLNRYDLLQRMLDTVDYKISHLVLVDNSDNLTSIRFPEKIKNVHYIPLPANLGVAGSWNLGIKVLPHHDRWFFASNDIMFAPGDLERLATAKSDELTVSHTEPFFQAFAVGEEVVRHVGLFDECFHPAFGQDIDYLRRTQHQGFQIQPLPLGVTQDGSSPLSANQISGGKAKTIYRDNVDYYQAKIRSRDFSAGHWSLTRRRRNEWLR